MRIRRSTAWGIALALTGVWAYSKRAASFAQLHPELHSPLLRFRSPPFTSTFVKLTRRLPVNLPVPGNISFETQQIPGPSGAPDVTVYVYRPLEQKEPTPAVIYLHGGGFVIGSAPMFHSTAARYVRELGVVVVNVEYRLAPETPFPGPLEDAYAALKWMGDQAQTLGIDSDRIAVVGDSAGGGLAAALAQLAHDRDGVQAAFQLLLYPMLDDRTVLKTDHQGRGEFLWTPTSNQLGWSSYLGRPPLLDAAPEYASPARRQNLSGLPPAWIGVGTLDLFYLEDQAYARRLNAAGVPCEFVEVSGAYHASETLNPNAAVSKAFLEQSMQALRRGLRLA
ncbi:alpha/beta hydrolase [Deinococcus aquatilis]|uniref:alpha/beta hydrolase n=1 Tax=Deinococcus aquatilis TaxID=519440 RepID=UPI0004774CE9|nr:alpha/beta hydrolase [Deinococcus aquatilis]